MFCVIVACCLRTLEDDCGEYLRPSLHVSNNQKDQWLLNKIYTSSDENVFRSTKYDTVFSVRLLRWCNNHPHLPYTTLESPKMKEVLSRVFWTTWLSSFTIEFALMFSKMSHGVLGVLRTDLALDKVQLQMGSYISSYFLSVRCFEQYELSWRE